MHPPTTPSELEQRWIDAWNALYELTDDHNDVPCVLHDGSIVDVETCKEWLQQTAYAGGHVKMEAAWVLGKRGIKAISLPESCSAPRLVN